MHLCLLCWQNYNYFFFYGTFQGTWCADSVFILDSLFIEKEWLLEEYWRRMGRYPKHQFSRSVGQVRPSALPVPALLLGGLRPAALRDQPENVWTGQDSWRPFSIKFSSPYSSDRLGWTQQDGYILYSFAWGSPACTSRGVAVPATPRSWRLYHIEAAHTIF